MVAGCPSGEQPPRNTDRALAEARRTPTLPLPALRALTPTG
jgi:hypothetical protein